MGLLKGNTPSETIWYNLISIDDFLINEHDL